jgi:hypothetical protein
MPDLSGASFLFPAQNSRTCARMEAIANTPDRCATDSNTCKQRPGGASRRQGSGSTFAATSRRSLTLPCSPLPHEPPRWGLQEGRALPRPSRKRRAGALPPACPSPACPRVSGVLRVSGCSPCATTRNYRLNATNEPSRLGANI